jgi:hypothetical protein
LGIDFDVGSYIVSFGLSTTSQPYFSLRTNQPPAISQQYFYLRTNQHQPSATSQTNKLIAAARIRENRITQANEA